MNIARGNIVTVEWGPGKHQRETGMAIDEHVDMPKEWFIVSQQDKRNYSGPVSKNHTTGEEQQIEWVGENWTTA